MAQINLGKVAFIHKGTYSTETQYNKFDIVTDGSSSYVSAVEMNIGNSLSLETYWKIMSKGFEPTHGTTEQRPAVNLIGAEYFDTTLSKPIWHNGTNWIDALGTIV